MHLLNVLLYETDYMKGLPVCHHPNAISENNKEFDTSVIMHDYQFLNYIPPKAHARQFLTNCENTISMSHFHKQILRQPQHFSGFNSHCDFLPRNVSCSQFGKIWIITEITQSVMRKCKTIPEVLQHMAGLLEYLCMNTRKLHSENKCI